MSASPTGKPSSGGLLDALGSLLPDCQRALAMARLGAERPLHLGERLTLAYNWHLCLHCQCQRERFDLAVAKLRAAEAARRAAGR